MCLKGALELTRNGAAALGEVNSPAGFSSADTSFEAFQLYVLCPATMPAASTLKSRSRVNCKELIAWTARVSWHGLAASLEC